MPTARVCRRAVFLLFFFILAASTASLDCIESKCLELDDETTAVQLVQRRANGSSEGGKNAQKSQVIVGTLPSSMAQYFQQKLHAAETFLLSKSQVIVETLPSPMAQYFQQKLNATEIFLLSIDSTVAHQAKRTLDTFPIDKYACASFICCLGLVALILSIWFLSMNTVTDESIRAFTSPAKETIKTPELYFTSPLNELIAMLGIPAFCVLPFSRAGSTGLQIRVTILLLATQCWVLQGASLFFLLEGIRAAMPVNPMSRFAVALATYLNVLGHLGELPVSLLLLRHAHEFHESVFDKVLAVTVCFIGGVLAPCAAIVIGAFFLSTAANYCDLFMKSCVFKFISNIDTWVVLLNSRINLVAGSIAPQMVHLPRDKEISWLLNCILCVIPVVPALIVLVLSGISTALREE